MAFGVLEIVAALAPSFWLFALLMAPLGMFGMTVNVTANTSRPDGHRPGHARARHGLYMMVFLGGTPLGAPMVGWITDAYGPRVGFAVGGLIATVAAVVTGLILARVGGLRLSVGWHHGHPRARFVPRELKESGAESRESRESGSRGRGSSMSTMNTMRLFAAVLPPAEVIDELALAVGGLRSLPEAGRLRWTDRPGWHFTLAFYGEVDEDVVPGLSERLERAARRTEPFPLALRGGGQFGRGRALWAGAEGDLEAIRLLADRTEAAARKAGVPMGEHRRYTPHLTVARSREPVDVRPYVAALGAFTSRTWTVSEVLLVRSNLPSSGWPGSSRGTRRSPAGRSERPVNGARKGRLTAPGTAG